MLLWEDYPVLLTSVRFFKNHTKSHDLKDQELNDCVTCILILDHVTNALQSTIRK